MWLFAESGSGGRGKVVAMMMWWWLVVESEVRRWWLAWKCKVHRRLVTVVVSGSWFVFL